MEPSGTTLKILRHFENMPLPSRGHETDAGLDLTAMAFEEISPCVFAFDTGISVAVEPGYYCEVVPRSSIIKTPFIMANSVGVIDPDYRGRIKVIFRYVGHEKKQGQNQGPAEEAAQALVGTRIAQILVRKRESVQVMAVESLDETPRGEGGFGSTGKK